MYTKDAQGLPLEEIHTFRHIPHSFIMLTQRSFPLPPATTTIDVSPPSPDAEPSSLSLAERRAFFSSLCEGSSDTSNAAQFFSRALSRSPTERSSCATPTPTVTPTPAATPPLAQTSPKKEKPSPRAGLREQQQEKQQEKQQREQAEQQQREQREQEQPCRLSQSYTETRKASLVITAQAATVKCTLETALQEEAPKEQQQPTAAAPRRLKLRTVGKLVLPEQFLSERNNKNNYRNSCLGRLQTVDDIHISMGVRPMPGKIKSPFIEQQQQREQQHLHLSKQLSTEKTSWKSSSMHAEYAGAGATASDSGDDTHSSDSGKENCAANRQGASQESTPAQHVSQLRRKLSQLAQQPLAASSAAAVNRRHTTELGGSASTGSMCQLRASNRSMVAERYGKFFGLDESNNSNSMSPTTPATPKAAAAAGGAAGGARPVAAASCSRFFGQNESYDSTTTLQQLNGHALDAGQAQPAVASAAPPPAPAPASAPPATANQMRITYSTVPAPRTEARNMHVRLTNSVPDASASLMLKRRELLKRTRGMTLEVHAAMPSAKRVHATPPTPTPCCVNFEDIEVPVEELLSAHDDFERLCDILSVT